MYLVRVGTSSVRLCRGLAVRRTLERSSFPLVPCISLFNHGNRFISVTSVSAQEVPSYNKLIEEAKRNIKEVTVEQVNQRLEKAEKFFLVDVRESQEWDAGRIPKAVHLSRGTLERKIESAIPQLDADIVLYCAAGARSALSAESLQRMGYKNVTSMAGGFGSWLNAGYRVVK